MLAVRFKDNPAHTGLFEDATGEEGIALTVTTTVAAGLVQPEAVAVTLYVPLAATVGEAIVGFWTAEAKPFGPVHE